MDIISILNSTLLSWPVLLVGAGVGAWEVYRFRKWLRLTKRPCNLWGLRLGRFEEWKSAPGIPIIFTLIYLAVVIALMVLSYLLAPKPKTPKPTGTKDLADPVAEAGMPIPTVFGTVTIKGLNALWYGDKRKVRYKVSP